MSDRTVVYATLEEADAAYEQHVEDTNGYPYRSRGSYYAEVGLAVEDYPSTAFDVEEYGDLDAAADAYLRQGEMAADFLRFNSDDVEDDYSENSAA